MQCRCSPGVPLASAGEVEEVVGAVEHPLNHFVCVNIEDYRLLINYDLIR